MEKTSTYPYIKIKPIAIRFLSHFVNYCEKIEIVGSIRRKTETSHDIDIVAVIKRVPSDLFGSTMIADPALNEAIKLLEVQSGNIEGKMMNFYFEGVHVDLYLTEPDNFGWIFALRTGSKEFNFRYLEAIKRAGITNLNGNLFRDGRKISVPTEEEFYRVIGMEYVEPKNRS